MEALREPAISDASNAAMASRSVTPVVIVRAIAVRSELYQRILPIPDRHMAVFELDLLDESMTSEVSVPGWADALEELLDAIPAVSAICIGDGAGSLVVEHFAATRPDRVEKLVLVNPIHDPPSDTRSELAQLANTIATEGVEAFDRWAHSSTDLSLAGVSPQRLAAALRTVAGAHTSDLRSIGAATLVCFDGENADSARAASALSRQLPTAQRAEFIGGGMSLLAANPSELATTVGEFLASNPGEDA